MNTNTIFVDDNNKPLLVFLDSTHPALSKDRRDLIRTLKNGGADLQFSPDNAEIILAQEGAAHFANSHRHKVVLDVGWVHASVGRGRCFIERENWGNYRVLPTEEGPQDPQPITEHAATPPARSASIPPMFNGGVPGQLPMHAPVSNAQPSGSMQAMPFGLQWAPFLQQLGGNAYQPPSAPQAPALNPYVPQALQAQLPASAWAANPAILLGGPLMTVPVLLQQAILDQMTNLAPDNPHSKQLNALVLALFAQQQQSTMNTANSTGLPHTQPTASASVSSAPPSRRDSSTHPSTSERKQQKPSSSRHQERTRSPAPSRPSSAKKQPASAPPSGPLKRKSRDESTIDRTKQRRVSRAEVETNSARATLKSKKREATQAKSTSRGKHGLFVDEHGNPIPFYVQSGTKWRNDSVSAIRQLGGEIVADISNATYVVLWPEVDHSYERLRETLIHEKTAVRSAWVRDAAEHGKLMDPSEERYTLDGRRLRDRTKKEVLVDLVKMETEVETERNKLAKSKLRKSLQLGSKQAARPSAVEQVQQRYREEGNDDEEEREVLDTVNRVSENQTDDDPEGSALPVPPTEAVPQDYRRNKFTDTEMEYCEQYCMDVLNDDPTITTAELAARLSAKMPQHSAGSWNNKLRALRQEFEDKARHKAVSPREADKDVVQPDVPADTESAGAGPSTPQVKPPNSPPPPLPPHYQEDLDILISFLLTLVEVQDEALAWRQLSDQHTCRSAPSWEIFWTTYYARVNARLQELSETEPAT